MDDLKDGLADPKLRCVLIIPQNLLTSAQRLLIIRPLPSAWTFHTRAITYTPDARKTAGGANNWSEFSIDEARGIAYVLHALRGRSSRRKSVRRSLSPRFVASKSTPRWGLRRSPPVLPKAARGQDHDAAAQAALVWVFDRRALLAAY